MGKKDRSRSRSRKHRHKERSRDHKQRRSRDRKEKSRSKERKEKSRSKERKERSRFTEAPGQNVVAKAAELTTKMNENLYGAKEEIKKLSIMQKINPVNKNIGLGLTYVEGSSSFPMGLNTGVFSMMTDQTKIKRKIMLPKDSNFNYSGLLIGHKGNAQKQLQEKTGCKIVVRGKGAQQTGEDYDDEDLHVLVLGDTEAQVAKACTDIEHIIFSDDDTLNKMKNEQMVQVQPGLAGQEGDFNLSLTTPYGPPSESAYVVQVPNECVGLVIGKEGQTIKEIAKRSGAIKVQVATSSAPGANTRNIFVEGDMDAVERVRKELNTIVQSQRRMNSGATVGSHRIEMEVPVRLIGLVIGKNGETIKGINTKTGAFVSLSKDEQTRKNRKILTICGPQDLCLIARYEVEKIIQKGLTNLHNTNGLTAEEEELIKPITPIALQLAQLNIPIPTQIQTIQEDPTTQYVLNQALHSHVPTSALYDNFLGPTKQEIEQVIIEDPNKVKPKRKWGNQ